MTIWNATWQRLQHRWNRGLPLRYTLVAVVVASVIIPGAVLLTIEQQLSARSQDEMLIRSENAFMAIGRVSLAEPIWSVDRDAIQAAVQRLLDNPQVVAVRVEDTLGTFPPMERVRSGLVIDLDADTADGKLRRYSQDVTRGPEQLGQLTVWFDMAYGQAQRSQRRYEMVSLVAVQVLASVLLLALVLVVRVFRPLERLKAQASALLEPSPETPVAPFVWPRNDELGMLGRHLVQVQEQLRTLFLQLETKNSELQKMAMYDHLTDLPNRAFFIDLVQREIQHAKRSQQRFAVFFIDLDRFKAVNDTLGHAAGDALLMELAHRLKETVREVDLVCRQSGDEFLVMARDVKQWELMGEIADRILRAMELPVDVSNGVARVSASIGIALYPDDGEDFETLIKHADVAMYQAKSLGRARYSFFHNDLNARAMAHLELGHQIADAIAAGHMVLHYQPKVDAHTGELQGLEALIRWNHPQRGLLYPGQFVSVAEECGHIADLGAWTLREACWQMAQWRARGLSVGTMAINVSAMEFRDHRLVEGIRRNMQEFALAASDLEIEITESVLMAETDSSLRIITHLRELGVGIAIDDFGTGYSSLSYLKRLHPTLLKLDRSFVRDADADDESRAMVKGIIGLAQALNLDMVAEGVETAAQLAFLRDGGCQIVQGYLVARPMPADQLEQWLKVPTNPAFFIPRQ